MYPDQSLYPADSVPLVVKRINNTLLRADQIQHHAEGRQGRHRLAAADRGRCRSRFRRRAQCLRADEGDDRSRRRRRALRRPAGLGEEVRPHGRQGAGADPEAVAEADRRAPGRRRDGRADPDRRAHRRRGRRPADLRHRRRTTSRSAPASARSKASTRPATASTRRSAAAWPMRRTPTWSGARPASRTWSSRASSPKPSTRSSRASCWPTTARRRFNWKKNLDDATIAKFQKELGGDGLQVPVHHPGRLPRAELLDVQPGLRLCAPPDERLRRSCRKPSSPRPTAASPRSSTSAKSAPATSTR